MVAVLGELPIEDRETELIRLASRRDVDRFCEQQGLDEKDISEVVQFLESQGGPKDLVDQIFKRKSRLAKTNYATRFSDGSFPVLYGSMEHQTAEAEAKHWFSRHVSGKPAGERTVWYTRFTYRFSGKVKDLRPTQRKWPALTHDNDYKFCNKLGTEAVEAGLDGLLAPSARSKGGTNLPAFARRAVNNFGEGELVSITYHPQTGRTLLREVRTPAETDH